MKPISAAIIHRRSALAVLLPSAAWLLSRTVYLNALRDIAWETGGTRRLGQFVIAGLIALELHYALYLWRWLGAGCRAAVFNAMRTDPAEIEKRRRQKLGLAAVALSSSLAFGLAEFLFRVLDIKPPPVILDAQRHDDARNAMGLREEWDFLPDTDKRLRIAFLGDSFVYGDGVTSAESFCHLVQGMLDGDWPTGVVTINMGEPGTSPAWQRRIYLKYRDIVHPDVVVHVIYINDFGINLHELLKRIYQIRDETLWVGNRSRVLRFAEKQIRYHLAWRYTLDYFQGGQTEQQRADSWSAFERDVRAVKDDVEAGGATYCLVLFPWLFRLDEYPLRVLHDKMKLFARELGVPYLDLLSVFEHRNADALRVNLANEHPNADGHALAADRIARFLRAEVLR